MEIGKLAVGLAANRALFGLGYLVAPERTARGWVGSLAARPEATILTRALGARDLALSLGALNALRDGDSARNWFAAQTLADAADFMATLAARRALPARSVAFALTMAGVSTAIAGAYTAKR